MKLFSYRLNIEKQPQGKNTEYNGYRINKCKRFGGNI